LSLPLPNPLTSPHPQPPKPFIAFSERFGLDATARASFAFYNDEDDLASLIRGLETVRRIFA